MASAIYLILFFLHCAVFTVVTSQERNSNISSGSILFPTKNDSWLSPSGLFAFGFYPESNGFFVGIWLNNGNRGKTVVWTSNQTDPPLSSNVSLQFTNGKGVFLSFKEGPEISITSISGNASSASMLDSGNFVIYSSDSVIIWQSFDWPTDTLLSGQSLRPGKGLVSSVSTINHSKGRFDVTMQLDGNLVNYPSDDRRIATAYWSSKTSGSGNNVSLNLNTNGHLYLIRDGSIILSNLTRGFPQNGSSILLYRLTLDFDGVLRLYSISLNRNSSNWSIIWVSLNDACAGRNLCGENGYCTVIEQKTVCFCLPGFDFVDLGLPFSDCQKKKNFTEEGCGTNDEYMYSLDGITWEENSYSMVKPTTEDNCKESCLFDCKCEVAVFYNNEQCSKEKLPMKYGSKNSKTPSKTFVKMSKWIPPRNEQVEEKGNKKLGLNTILLISLVVITSTALIFLVICSIIFHKYRLSAYERMKDQVPLQNESEDIVLRSFTYGELEKLTDNFKEELGRGAFGTVFKGTLSNNEEKRLIAAKRLEKVADEGEIEFRTEMKVIGRTHHRNLVRLLGYCDSRFNKVLVYEYMSNGSLADLLFKSKEYPCWYERVGIALNIAKGILYLHEECETQIIHCDIKPQNILMDEYLCPKISDFGLAKLLKQDQTRTLTMIRGTRGYVAPEWYRNRPITVKVDVFSFGIVLLEIICCRRCVDTNFPEEEAVLSDWVYDSFEDGELAKLAIDEDVDQENLKRIVKVGLWCIQEDPSMRPSMKKVVLMLEGIVEVPSPPIRGSFSNL